MSIRLFAWTMGRESWGRVCAPRDGSQNQAGGDGIKEGNRPEQLFDQGILIEVARLTGDREVLARLIWKYLDQKASPRWM